MFGSQAIVTSAALEKEGRRHRATIRMPSAPVRFNGETRKRAAVQGAHDQEAGKKCRIGENKRQAEGKGPCSKMTNRRSKNLRAATLKKYKTLPPQRNPEIPITI